MKKYLLFPVLAFSIIMFTGCSDDDGGDDVRYALDLPSYAANTEYMGDLENPVEIIEEEWGDYYHTRFTDNTKVFVFNCYVGPWGYAGGFMFTNATSGNYSSVTKKGINGGTYVTAGTGFYNPVLKFVDKEDQSDSKMYTVNGMYISNSYYAYDSMLNGDGYAKKFEDGDWYMLTIYNSDKSKKVEAYLADFRNGKNELVNEWKWVDLTSLGKTNSLYFELSSSDEDEINGMYTPAYFCLDGIQVIQ